MSLTAAAVCIIILCDVQAQESGVGAAGHGRAAFPPCRAGGRLASGRGCGKEGCRCTRGEPHGPYVYLQVAGRLVYVPAGLAEVVRAQVETSRRLRGMLEDISAINLELLARRELD